MNFQMQRDFFSCNEFSTMPRQIEKKRRKKRKKRSAPAYSPADHIDSLFWKSYVLPARDPTVPIEKNLFNVESRRGNKFRRRFRVPYQIFVDICSSLMKEGWYTPGFARNGWPKIDVELLILEALRVLAAGCSFDLVKDLTNVNEVTHRNFFHYKFFKRGKGLADVFS